MQAGCLISGKSWIINHEQIDCKDFREEKFPKKSQLLNFEHPFSQTKSGKTGFAQNVRKSNYCIEQEKSAGLA